MVMVDRTMYIAVSLKEFYHLYAILVDSASKYELVETGNLSWKLRLEVGMRIIESYNHLSRQQFLVKLAKQRKQRMN